MTMYAKYFYGFDPEVNPGITFTFKGECDSLVKKRNLGEVIVYVGTKGRATAENERGRLLGAAAIGNQTVRSEDLMDLSNQPDEYFEAGKYTVLPPYN